jgi:hypothetical protein
VAEGVTAILAGFGTMVLVLALLGILMVLASRLAGKG